MPARGAALQVMLPILHAAPWRRLLVVSPLLLTMDIMAGLTDRAHTAVS